MVFGGKYLSVDKFDGKKLLSLTWAEKIYSETTLWLRFEVKKNFDSEKSHSPPPSPLS